jgi:hypothetical protein
MNRSTIGAIGVAAIACAGACSSDPNTGTGVGHLDPRDAGVLDAASATPDASDAAAWVDFTPETSTQRIPNPNCTTQKAGDNDGDGFSVEEGDCNDCDKTVNPGAYDFPGNDFDEDCSGKPADKSEAECDQGLDIASSAAEDAARAIGLCKFTSMDKRDWGVISARFTTADGSGSLDSPLQVGLLPKFGVAVPRAGSTILALSSGVARAPDQPAYTRSLSDTFGADRAGHTPPAGFPKPSSVCPRTPIDGAFRRVFNQAALEVKVRVPSNAFSLSFDSIFYSYEYPDYICQPGNDFFITLLEPIKSGDGDIVFDTNGDPIGVNNGLLAVCDPALQNPDAAKQFECKQGVTLLQGTGFARGEYTERGLLGETEGEGGASTGWLTTLAPSVAGSIITLRFAVWDTADADMDSTVLIDRFAWSVQQPTTASTTPTPELL